MLKVLMAAALAVSLLPAAGTPPMLIDTQAGERGPSNPSAAPSVELRTQGVPPPAAALQCGTRDAVMEVLQRRHCGEPNEQ